MSVGQVVRAMGVVESYYTINREVTQSVEFGLPVTLNVSVTGIEEADSLRIFADQNLMEALNVIYLKGHLTLGLKPNRSVTTDKSFEISLSIPRMADLSVSKAGRVVFQHMQGPLIHCEIKDDAVVTALRGRLGQLSLTLSENAQFQGGAVETNFASVILLDHAVAYIKTPNQDLEITARGNSICYYNGSEPRCSEPPKIKNNAALRAYQPI
ncbi:MAG TPA: hypothetical protein VMR37_04235 [Rhabdochlamydiaceae bacterium]|nr:hypothetical protein [Rhabdochlamydiaceae bacterium]